MLKLVVADFDGTLLPYSNKTVPESTITLIETLISKGVAFAVSSGRTYSELSALLKKVSDKIFFICDDGALTIKNENVIFKKPFSKKSLSCFFDSDVFKYATLYSMNKAYLVGDNKSPVLYDKSPKKVSRPFEITEDVFKVFASPKTFTLEDTSDYRVHYSEKGFTEFVSPFANKGVALAHLQLHLGVTKFDTAAIGDASNDIPMMSHAKYSFSIGDKSKELNKICTYNSRSAEEALQKLVSFT
ncbi:MAG: HAD family phosphatase [Ruminococcaceae bacterium]|nr:HAD family phosphatase [Oscillospiraceae bacterium]